MTLYTYDIEVFRYDWLVIFKRATDGKYFIYHNDIAAVKEFMQNSDCLLGGFNSKHYDCHILKAICCGADNALLKDINDWIIAGNQGFDHWFIKNNKYWFNHFDIRDDMQQGLSLKAIEGHLGLNVEETSVPFDIDRPLTQEELDMTIHYCKHDVDTAEHLIKIRKGYLDGKIALGRMKDIPDVKAMYATNAKITAMFLGANQRKWTDEREYQYPPNLNRERIPPEVLDFFEKIHDESIPSDKLFKMKLNIIVDDCEFVYGFGGIHGAIPTYQEEEQGTRIIRNYDVASLYPSLMIYCGYTSRNIESAAFYEKVYHDRLAAKASGDKKTANTLKLCLNTTYGAMLNKYNGLHDPLMGRSVCISGQLFLTELACGYLEACKTVKIIQINTDGVMISFDESEYDKVQAVNAEWEKRTKFTLEEDNIRKVVQKDVNNYIIVKSDGSIKVKGGYLTYGISQAGAWNINNNATIIKKALAEYFANGVPVEETILNCDDIFEFQFIAKAGAKYKEAYHIVDGKKVPVQKVNRVYATKDERYGTLSKVKTLICNDDKDEQTRSQKIESLPLHCIIDNDNHLTIAEVDKDFYIEVAKKRVNDFLGIKVKKGRKAVMASSKKTVEKSTEGMTFLQKLFYLQTLMDEFEWEKDGKNMHQSYKFISEKQYKHNFKAARRKAGLLWECECLAAEYIPAISDKMHLVKGSFLGRLTDPETGEYREYHFEGTGADNGDKALYKAYTGGLKFFLADQYLVAEGNDPEFDEDTDADTAATPKMSTKPATEGERKEIKENLTNTDGAATKLQISQLKKSLKMLREADPAQEDFIQQVAEATDNFTNITKSACEKLMLKIGEMLDEAGEE